MPRHRQRRRPPSLFEGRVEGRDYSPEALARVRAEVEAGLRRLHAQLEAKRLDAPPHVIEAARRAEAGLSAP